MTEVGSLLRHASIRELCAICSESAEAECLRCGKPFCAVHAPAANERCDACEALWLERSDELRRSLPVTPGKLLLIAAGGLVATGFAFGAHHVVTAIFGYAAVVLVLLAPFVLIDESATPLWLMPLRRRFLRERKHLALSAGDGDKETA